MTDAVMAPRWAPHEQPRIPGSAPTPDHWPWVRVLYGLVGVLVGLTGGLGNALVTVNIASLQASLGVGPMEGAWLTAIFTMTGAAASVLLFKMRRQFGLRLFTEIGLTVYVLLILGNLVVRDFESALLVRAASGFTSACLGTLGVLYILQAVPARYSPRPLALGLGLSSLATPLARLFSTDLLQLGDWQGLYLFELGLALMSLGAVVLLKLPPSEKAKAFEPLDLVTFALFLPGVAALAAVLGLGRVVWWTEAPWIGWALIGAILLIGAAFLIEHHRANPLIDTRWLASADILRLAFVSVLVRIVLALQSTSGAVGLLQAVGVGNDQLAGLSVVILIATAAGVGVSALTLDPARLGPPMLAALALMAVGAFMEADASNLSRPANLYAGQALLAFGAALFTAPSVMYGVARALARGPALIISFMVVYSLCGQLGALVGSALAGTLQTYREVFHSSQLVAAMNPADPLVAGRLQAMTGAYARIQTDPALRGAQGAALVSQQATREANVLAYNDVFLLVGGVTALTFLWLGVTYLRAQLRTRQEALALRRAHPGSGNL